MSASDPDAVPSPCVGRCGLDAERRYCLGCLRTRDEIANWSSRPPAWKRAVLARLQAAAGNRCPRCGTAFACGSGGTGGGCWCADLPQVLPVDDDTRCLCPSCLRERLAEAHRLRGLPQPG